MTAQKFPGNHKQLFLHSQIIQDLKLVHIAVLHESHLHLPTHFMLILFLGVWFDNLFLK